MNKQQYLSIITSWKQYIKEGKHKKYKVWYNAWILKKGSSWDGEIAENYGYYWTSNLTSLHHLIYSLIRRKNLLKAFKDNDTLIDLIYQLKHIINHGEKKDSYNYKAMQALLVPFGEEFTYEMLKSIVDRLK